MGVPDGYRAFRWTPSAGMQIIGTPTVFFSYASAINEVGQVVGNNGSSEVWTPTGGWVDIGTLGGTVRPVANNNLGQVVGTSNLEIASFPAHAFIWSTSGGMVDLGTLGGPSSAAAAVSQSGHVVGSAQIAGASPDTNWRAFLWTAASGMVNLGSLGGPFSVARDVNETDMVVGTSAVAPGNPAVHAFLWTSAAGMRDLGTLGGTDSDAYAVSDTGIVVGRSSTPGDAASHAFVWTASSGMVDLVPLAGYTDSVAYLVNTTGAVVGSSYDRISGTYRATMWDASGAPPVGDWTFCATEGALCAFTGTMDVRYGANGSFVVKTLTDGTACTNEVFGDPAPDTPKQCATRAASTTPPPSDWTFCATEGALCAFTGTMEVRYGANGSFVVKTLTDGTACTNEVFGDPAPDTPKQCAIRAPSTPPPTDWTFCAPEGGVCAFTGTMQVRYGANGGSFFVKTLTDGTACTNEVFGDPAPNVAKSCSLPQTGP
jgi:probable HAF family extracellular repeat protein